MYDQNQQKTIIRFSILGVGLLLVISIVWFVYNFSFLEIKPGWGGDFSVLVDGEAKSVKDGSTHKQLLRRGFHEVMVRQNNDSYYQIVQTGSLFKTTKIAAELKPEKNREFIGNSPFACMDLIDSILVSYVCGGEINKTLVHRPASKSTPTYTTNIDSPFSGQVEAVINNLMFVKADETSHEQAPHSVFRIKNSFEIDRPQELNGLDESASYKFKPVRKGYVAISTNLTDVFYFSNLASRAERINIPKPGNDTHLLNDIDVSGDKVVFLFSDSEPGSLEPLDGEDIDIKEQSIEVILTDGENDKHVNIKGYVGGASLCGDQVLCVFGNQQLSIYDISGDRPKLTHRIEEVDNFHQSEVENIIVLSKPVGTINFNVKTGEGFIDYSLGNNQICGIAAQAKGYVACVIINNQKSALYISNSGANDNIDKKVSALSASGVIERVSVYRNSIFISPNLRSLTFTPGTASGGYNPEELNKVNDQVLDVISQSEIDRSKYTIVNPYDN